MLSLAFEIGFDHYHFNLPLRICRFPIRHRHAIRNGYKAASIQGVTQDSPDPFERKLVCIRERALVKGLSVKTSAHDLIVALDKSKGVCPITLLPFTFSENKDTDWSVDLIDNSQGYYPNNIVIVSQVVNQAKSHLDLSGLINGVIAPHNKYDALSQHEWLRMAKFYYQIDDVLSYLNNYSYQLDR